MFQTYYILLLVALCVHWSLKNINFKVVYYNIIAIKYGEKKQYQQEKETKKKYLYIAVKKNASPTFRASRLERW